MMPKDNEKCLNAYSDVNITLAAPQLSVTCNRKWLSSAVSCSWHRIHGLDPTHFARPSHEDSFRQSFWFTSKMMSHLWELKSFVCNEPLQSSAARVMCKYATIFHAERDRQLSRVDHHQSNFFSPNFNTFPVASCLCSLVTKVRNSTIHATGCIFSHSRCMEWSSQRAHRWKDNASSSDISLVNVSAVKTKLVMPGTDGI